MGRNEAGRHAPGAVRPFGMLRRSGGHASGVWLESAARVITRARRAVTARWFGASRRGPPPLPLPPPARLVERIACRWDRTALTALEYAESLAPDTVDALLSAAPHWELAAGAAPEVVGEPRVGGGLHPP